VYLGTLFIEMKKAGDGCFIANWLVAAIRYADDVVLLASTIARAKHANGVYDVRQILPASLT